MKTSILVDVYNLQHSVLSSHLKSRIPNIRRLAYVLERYASIKDADITLVFDGTRYKDDIASSSILRLEFSEPGVTADTHMERFMASLPEINRIRWTLISNDNNLRQMASGMGLRLMKCMECISELDVLVSKGDRADVIESLNQGRERHSKHKPFNNPFKDL